MRSSPENIRVSPKPLVVIHTRRWVPRWYCFLHIARCNADKARYFPRVLPQCFVLLLPAVAASILTFSTDASIYATFVRVAQDAIDVRFGSRWAARYDRYDHLSQYTTCGCNAGIIQHDWRKPLIASLFACIRESPHDVSPVSLAVFIISAIFFLTRCDPLTSTGVGCGALFYCISRELADELNERLPVSGRRTSFVLG